MELIVNGKKHPLNLEKISTFSEVMSALNNALINDETVISKISVNGETIGEERERALATLPKEDITHIEVYTKHPLDLAHESMMTALPYMQKLLEALRQNARSFRLKDSAPVENEFQACIDGLLWVFQLIHALKVPLRIDGTEVVSGEKSFLDLETESISAINELCDAREKENKIELADSIEYDLIPVLEAWRQWFLQLTDVDVALKNKISAKRPKAT